MSSIGYTPSLNDSLLITKAPENCPGRVTQLMNSVIFRVMNSNSNE